MRKSYKKIIEENVKLHRLEASFYEIQHQEIFNYFEQSRLRKEMKSIVQELSPGPSFALDIGSGTGNLTKHLNFFGVRTVTCDLSEDMLKYNRNKYKVICDACYLPFKRGSFELVTTYSLFHHLPNVKKALEEICRVATKHPILYFDHDPFIQKEIKSKELFQHIGWMLWLLTKPEFWIRFLEYIMWGRKWYLENIEKCDWTLTDGNFVSTEEILSILKSNSYIVEINYYGTGSYIKAKGKSDSVGE